MSFLHLPMGGGGGSAEITYTEYAAGNSGTTKTIDWANGLNQRVIATGNCTYTFTNPTLFAPHRLIIETGTGGFTATLPSTVNLASLGTYTQTTAARRLDILEFYYSSSGYSVLNIRQAVQDENYPFDPTLLSGCILWLDATDAATITHVANAVSQWNDKSSSGYIFTQATGANKPTYVSSGFGTTNAACIDFDGSNDFLQSTTNFSLSGDPAFTAFVVCKSDSVGNDQIAFHFGDTSAAGKVFGAGIKVTSNVYTTAFSGGNNVDTSDTAATNNPVIYVMKKSAGNVNATLSFRIDGAASAVGGSPPSLTPNITAAPLTVGSWSGAGAPFNGKIASIVVYNSALSAGDIVLVEDYLNGQFGCF